MALPTLTLFAKREPSVTGTSRYTAALARELAGLGWRTVVRDSRAPWPSWLVGLAGRGGIDPAAFWSSYPLVPPIPRGQLCHLTGQTIASAISVVRLPVPTVVTVHDVVPWLTRHDPELATLRSPIDRAFYRLALRGVERADRIIADSAFTAASLGTILPGCADRIRVVPLGVDRAVFHVDSAASPRQHLGIDPEAITVLYVGSEDPRKNLIRLVEGFARAAAQEPRLLLLKAGRGHHAGQRRALLDRISALGIGQRVRFLEDISDDGLRRLYGAADVCVVPSLFEGFGLPVLEAMACGAPLIYARTSSLPEVGGDAGLACRPTAQGFADAILCLVRAPERRAELRARGLARARRYTWRRTAELTAAVYDEALVERSAAG